MADELQQKLERRQRLIDDAAHGHNASVTIASQKPNEDNDLNSESINISDKASSELKSALIRRQHNENEIEIPPQMQKPKNVYIEFPEFSRKQIKQYEELFKKFDENKDKFICLEELKRAMEKLGSPQTHLTLKQMICEVDEDLDGKINFREFLLIFRKASAGELAHDSALSIFAQASEVDVTKEGVLGAKNFFDAKVQELAKRSAFEEEIRKEQEEKKRLAEEKRARHEEFSSKKKVFT